MVKNIKSIYTISVTKSQTARLSMYGIVLLFLSSALFQAVVGTNHTAMGFGIRQMIVVLGVYILTLIIHELVHGMAFKLFGGNVKYGAGIVGVLPYFYATSINQRFRLWQMYIIGLAPFVILSAVTLSAAVFLPSLATYFAIAFVGNFSGAVGDLWLMSQIVKFHKFKDVMAGDEKVGIAIYTSDPNAKQLVKKLDNKAQKNMFMSYWLWGTFSLFLLSIIIPVIGPIFKKSLSIGPDAFPLVQYAVTDKTAGFTLNLLSPIIAGLIFALIAVTILRLSRNKRLA